jgi:lipid A 3-O-deacylase
MRLGLNILLCTTTVAVQALEWGNPLPLGDQPGVFMISEENDKFSPINKDRYYTQGLKFSFNAGEHAYAAISQELNTPSNTTLVNPPLTELPYSAALYATYGYGTILDRQGRKDCLVAIEVQVGLVGPDAGGAVQNIFHRFIGQPTASGWATQLPNEPLLNFNAEFRKKIDLDPTGAGYRDLILRGVAEVGTMRTELITGAQFRWGVNLQNSWGHSYLRDNTSYAPAVAYQDISPDRPFAFWAFVDSELLVVMRNYATDGDVFNESRSVARVPIIGQFAVGASFQVYRCSISYFTGFRTREFETQDGYHYFAGLEATYRF